MASNVAAEEPSSYGGEIALPPDVWASVLEFVPFQTVLACAATSRSMLHDAIPLLRELSIDKSSEINMAVASRFREIREIRINSLFEVTYDDDIKDICLDFETKNRAVHFLSRFDKLERVFFGVKNEAGQVEDNFSLANGYFYEGDETYPYEGSRDRMLAFIDSISGAYRCGALPKLLRISGLCCPDTTNLGGHRGTECDTCLRACKNFPVEAVLCFDCRGSSISNARSGRSHELDVCLERAQVESIIESRPGGHELLRSSERLLRLLGSARRYKIDLGGDGKALYIVKYKSEELEEITRVIAYADLDVKKVVPMHKSTEAVLGSFATDDGTSIPPRSQRYFCETSSQYLESKVGICLDKEELGSSFEDLVECTTSCLGC